MYIMFIWTFFVKMKSLGAHRHAEAGGSLLGALTGFTEPDDLFQ